MFHFLDEVEEINHRALREYPSSFHDQKSEEANREFMLRKISYEASQCEGDGGEDAPEENAFDAHRCCFAVALLLLIICYFYLDRNV
eukprot:scaffold5090_cov109-Skeletonema_dohrnii-CCMP3373.AAC.1